MHNRLLLIGGIVNLVFSLFHIALGHALISIGTFSCLSLDNRATVYTLNVQVGFTCLAFAHLCFLHRKEMLGSEVATAVLAAIAAFWVLRAVNQVVFHGLSAVDTPFWVIVCLLVSALYLVPILGKRPASPAAMPSW